MCKDKIFSTSMHHPSSSPSDALGSDTLDIKVLHGAPRSELLLLNVCLSVCLWEEQTQMFTWGKIVPMHFLHFGEKHREKFSFLHMLSFFLSFSERLGSPDN